MSRQRLKLIAIIGYALLLVPVVSFAAGPADAGNGDPVTAAVVPATVPGAPVPAAPAAPVLPPVPAPVSAEALTAPGQFNTAAQQAALNPMDAAARANLSRATANALAASQRLNEAGRSGKYDKGDYLTKQMIMTALVQRQQPAGGGGDQSTRQSSVPARQVASVSAPQPASSQSSGNAQIVNISGNSSEPAVVVVSNSTSINLRFSNPGIAPTDGAKFVLENVKAAISEIQSGYDDKTLSPGGVLVSRVINSLRDATKKLDAPESTSPDSKNGKDNVRLDENAARGLPGSSALASENFEDLAGWTESKKEVLKELLKQALEKNVERASPEALAKENADSNLLAALKTAGRDPSVFDELVDDIADSVQSLAVNDRQISSFLSRKAAERDRARMAKAFLESGQQPVRAVASEKNLLPDLEIDLSNGKGLILLAIASILAVLFWTSRSKKA